MADKKTLDFTNVKDGGGAFRKTRQPAGDYRATITKAATVPIKDKAGQTQWLFTIKAGSGVYPYYCQFSAEALWKIRNLFVAAGFNVPKKKVAVDPNKIVGKVIGVTLADDEYDGKAQSTIDAVFPASELDGAEEADDEDEDEDSSSDDEEDSEEEDDEDEEDEEPPPPPKKKKKSAPVEDELDELDIEDI